MPPFNNTCWRNCCAIYQPSPCIAPCSFAETFAATRRQLQAGLKRKTVNTKASSAKVGFAVSRGKSNRWATSPSMTRSHLYIWLPGTQGRMHCRFPAPTSTPRVWHWNGDEAKPTLAPSIHAPSRWHGLPRNGGAQVLLNLKTTRQASRPNCHARNGCRMRTHGELSGSVEFVNEAPTATVFSFHQRDRHRRRLVGDDLSPTAIIPAKR